MVSTYIKVAYRHLMRSKFFTLINVVGLAIGLTAFLLILQYVSFELSYDQFHENKNQIYRVGYSQYENGGLKNTSAKNYVGLRSLMKDQFQAIESYTGFSKIPANTGLLFSYDGRVYNELGGVIHADTNFFKVFPSLLLRGDARTILSDPHNIMLSETKAKKIFGQEDPINKRLTRMDDDGDDVGYIVTGIFKDIPENAHFHADFIAYEDEDWALSENYWSVPHMYTYITLRNNEDRFLVEQRLNALMKRVESTYPTTKGTQVFLQPIRNIHLRSDLKDELEANGSITLVYILSLIGFIILVIAWINYVNFETARFTTRAKEIGIRRIVGSDKRALAMQFLAEYFCITVLSGVIAWAFLQLILPHFSFLTGIPISNIQWTTPTIWVSAFSLFVAGSILVGIYPALFLLKIDPIASIKGNFTSSSKGKVIRKSLITVQFVSSVVLLAFLFVVYKQVEYMQLSNKNIDIDEVITIRNPTSYSGQELEEKHQEYKTLEHTLLQHPSVQMLSSSSAIPGTEIGFTHVDLLKRNTDDPYDPTRYKCLFINDSFIPFYGLTLKA